MRILKLYEMISKTNIGGKLIIEIDQFLSEVECDTLLLHRKHKFEKAISHYPKYYRNNNRLEEDNDVLASHLLQKVKLLGIEELKMMKQLNCKFRFCQYNSGQKFSKHQDGVYFHSNTEASQLTFLLYLNDSNEFDGGETQFFNSKTDGRIIHEVKPTKGKLVIFDHQIWHNGGEVQNGTKYILRSDFIFENKNKSHHNGYIWTLTKVNNDSFLSGGRDALIKLWNKDFSLIKCFRFHKKSIIKIVPLGHSYYLSCSRDMTLKKWNLNGDVIKTITLDSMILSMDVNEGLIFTGDTSGNLSVYSDTLERVEHHNIHEGWVWDLKFFKENIYSVSDDGCLKRTGINGDSKALIKYKEGLFSVVIHEDEIICGSESGSLIRYSLHFGKHSYLRYHQDIIRRIVIKNNHIITASEDYTVCVDGIMVMKQNNFVQDIVLFDEEIISAGFSGKLDKCNLKF